MDDIYSIDIDLQTGEAFVGLIDADGNIEIVRIDRSCSEIMDGSIIPFQDVPGLIYIEQDSQGVLPFSIESISPTRTNNEEFDFSIIAANENEAFNPLEFFVEKTEIEGTFDSSEDEVEVDSPFTKVQVWGDENEGVRGVLAGGIPGLSHEEIRSPVETTRLPIFTWTSSGVVTNLLLFVGRDNGRIDMYSVNPSDLNRRSDVFELKKSLLGKNTPLRENPINSFGVNINSQNIFISSRRGVMLADSKTLQPLSYVKTNQDFKAQIQEPNGVLWGLSRLEGSLQKITRAIDKNEVSDESSEILTTSSSQSNTSSSMSSLSSLNSSSSSLSSINSSSSSIQSSSSISSQSPQTEIIINDPWNNPLEVELSQSEYNTLFTPYTGTWPWVLTLLPLTFPPTKVGSSSFARLIFRNSGSSSIRIRRIITYPPFFSVESALSDVPPGGTAGWLCRFSPGAVGQYNKDVLVDSSLSATGTLQGFSNSMQGLGIPQDGTIPLEPSLPDPDIFISPVILDKNVIDFGVVPKGSYKTETVNLINRDSRAHYCNEIIWDTAKNISCKFPSGAKWDSSGGFWLAGGATQTISVRFDSDDENTYIMGDILVRMKTGSFPPGWPLRCTVIGTSWPLTGPPED